MKHQCVKCSRIYAEDLPQVHQGCECGSRAFLFLRTEKTQIAQHIVSDADGKYEIDLHGAFIRKPEETDPVQSLEEGRYTIDIARALGEKQRKHREF